MADTVCNQLANLFEPAHGQLDPLGEGHGKQRTEHCKVGGSLGRGFHGRADTRVEPNRKTGFDPVLALPVTRVGVAMGVLRGSPNAVKRGKLQLNGAMFRHCFSNSETLDKKQVTLVRTKLKILCKPPQLRLEWLLLRLSRLICPYSVNTGAVPSVCLRVRYPHCIIRPWLRCA